MQPAAWPFLGAVGLIAIVFLLFQFLGDDNGRAFIHTAVAETPLLVSPTVSLSPRRSRLSPNTSTSRVPTTTSNYVEPMFSRRPEVADVDCARLFSKDVDYIEEMGKKKRRTFVPSPSLSMECSAIRARVAPFGDSPSFSSLNFSLAFARVVYTNYEFLELQLAANWHSTNFFCFSIDADAKADFADRMEKLQKCFPNVIVPRVRRNVDSAGHSMNMALVDCMQLLIDRGDWRYIVLLQNHDVIIKSNEEIAAIFSVFKGTNDAEITPPAMDRLRPGLKWTPRDLQLFPANFSNKIFDEDKDLQWAKGAVQASFSREAVFHLVRRLNLTKLLSQINLQPFGVDELMFPSLQISENVQLPGRFTSFCLKQKRKNTPFVTRMSHWRYGDGCLSGLVRHAICVLGVEDLPDLAELPQIMANKMLPDFDWSAISCTAELLFNRSFLGQNDHPLHMAYYENLPHVRYHKEHTHPHFKLQNFECDSKFEVHFKR